MIDYSTKQLCAFL